MEQSTEFFSRHAGLDADDIATMCKAVGVSSPEALLDEAMPQALARFSATQPPLGDSIAVTAWLREIAEQNEAARSLLGQGWVDTHTPPVIRRGVLENPAWYTAYTPYQPEIAQGRLEVLLAFQTMTADLTGLPLACSSLLDEATAGAEAASMLLRAARQPDAAIAVSRDLHAQTRAVIATRARAHGNVVHEFDGAAVPASLPDDVGVVVLSNPTTLGVVRNLQTEIAAWKERGIKVAVATDLLACAIVTPPGEMGADAAFGSAQRFGVPMMGGGPHAGFLTTTDENARSMPGRIVGVSRDQAGRPALRLALQAREQHIRRHKATSNICTSQVLLAIVAALYARWHGAAGLRAQAQTVARHAAALRAAAADAGRDASRRGEWHFDTALIAVDDAAQSLATLRSAGWLARHVDDETIALTLDETIDASDVTAIAQALGFGATAPEANATLPHGVARASNFMEAEFFNANRSETNMMRLLRRLADRDLALDRTMIPLGSCTMKLNAAVEMDPVTWPEFTNVHPLAPRDARRGTSQVVDELAGDLARLTGLPGVSLQPNAGSQGEFAGLITIRSYHEDRGDSGRNVCLIPASAHGTNAASAAMTGLDVVVVGTTGDGSIDMDDLRSKAAEAGDRLAALMITYPSTHGVYEETVQEACQITHDHGGQVYLDGANMNALLGVVTIAELGADVCHLNLHKTFCIPHGGGGPGVGPICVAEHLRPFLPSHPADDTVGGDKSWGPVSAAPDGSPGVLPISLAWVRLMGDAGLASATAHAVLSANYLAGELGEDYPILYRGNADRVAHECILDCRAFVDSAGVTVEDIAKRLIDYGFHAPTMAWPVAGTLMIEPTESEPLEELDRFVAAMKAIRQEIRTIETGEWPHGNNPLSHAPHTIDMIASSEWDRPYSREVATAVSGLELQDKYWPPVSRVDNAQGDRNLHCACGTLDEWRASES